MTSRTQKILRDFFYSNGRPTRAGRIANRLSGWWSALGLPPKLQQSLEVRGRKSGKTRAVPVVVTPVEGERYLVSMLGPQSEWVLNALADDGKAVLKFGAREPIRLSEVPVEERAPVLKEYVRIAPGGRRHFPLEQDAPLSEYAALADRYPVFRIGPRTDEP
jgi:hypothetical protein